MKQVKSNPAATFQDLLATPAGLNRQHPKALELVCDGPLQHWFGLPVSEQLPPYALSREFFQTRWVMRDLQRIAALSIPNLADNAP